MFFAKKIIVLSLLACCALLSAVEPLNSDIDSILIEKDSLIVKYKGQTYILKFSKLFEDKSLQSPKPVPKNLKEAFRYNGEWFFFNALHNRRNRLCHTKKQAYKVFKKGDLLERVLYKGKYYARDINNDIFRPDWEIKKDFSPHFIPAKQYLEALDNQIRLVQTKIKSIEYKIPLALSIFDTTKKRYNVFLTINNIELTTEDKKGNITIKQMSEKYSSKIKKELQRLYETLKEEEQQLKGLIQSFSDSGEKLQELLELKKELEFLYKKYVLKQNVTRPVKICF